MIKMKEVLDACEKLPFDLAEKYTKCEHPVDLPIVHFVEAMHQKLKFWQDRAMEIDKCKVSVVGHSHVPLQASPYFNSGTMQMFDV